ncbi:unnamed protein product [Litomosoides sigmodontis]|uniref:LicD/FKTN/FKRP nucleotidyltransferase domain-containing protein n=1 Tax=Litomosoides sigmodontis TaxID=42156 RepID=A0A3P6SZX7_LITSI|nr:unnamed protein product [Litomosoides sigmodontis]
MSKLITSIVFVALCGGQQQAGNNRGSFIFCLFYNCIDDGIDVSPTKEAAIRPSIGKACGMCKNRGLCLVSIRKWFALSIFVILIVVFNVLYTGTAWQLQKRYACKTCTELSVPELANFNELTSVISSMLQVNRHLQNKALFIDPRFTSEMHGAQAYLIDDSKLRIGEESVSDILEPNTVMMAFFDRDRLDILNLLKKHNLSWRKYNDQNLQVIMHGISHRLISFSISESKDYVEFVMRKVRRIMPKFPVMNYTVQNETFIGPANWTTFVWSLQRSKFIGCRKDLIFQLIKTYPQYYSKQPLIRNEIILTLQRFRNWAFEHGLTPMLHAGTLLGWYRECGIIPYTHDIDVAVFIEDHYDQFPEDVMNTSFIKLSLRFNKPEDLLEYKVYIENTIPMDVFFLYHDHNTSWIGGLSYTTKYRFVYPLINRTCSTNFLGYLMYVPCNALDVITTEYGVNWSKPLHSSKYFWNSSPLNKQEAGSVPPEERAESFINYESIRKKKVAGIKNKARAFTKSLIFVK